MIADVKTYAAARMVNLGYTEHKDALNYENIPAQMLGRAFHVMVGESRGIKNTMDSQDIDVDFTVRLFMKGSKDTDAARTLAISKMDAILAEMLAASNRLSATGLINVGFRSGGIDPIDGSNDNAHIVRAEFTARVVMGTR